MRVEPGAPSTGTGASLRAPGELLAWLAGIVLTLSTLMGWYSTEIDGVRYSVLAWHSGGVGKLVFVTGLAVLGLLVLRATRVELARSFPTGMAIAALGATGTILVLIRLIDIPDDYAEATRSTGIWISLLAALSLIVAGVLKAGDEV